MEEKMVRRNRYRVSFHRGDVLEHQLGALGTDDRNAIEVAKKYLSEVKGVDCSKLLPFTEPKPMTIRLGDNEGIEVIDLLKLSAE
ncbi:hypothetical protein [Comamonas terrigena]|uniref:Uncharacterized protein n=1 Tax=Comamonas terrigena TaxID=32013 RepID=A0A2A7UXN9_COMTR|nr:hypothetical protein [Comamonas terrigena]PEH90052.1 hypothetical protein CRM82_16945 [Comamonas terrigena]BBL25340.1 hypothetical protein CT3_27950 [Comamonas terrigena NBRC 13299]SUY71082.1 Uncharacterised protein [Comamonas terrigena]